MKTTRQVLISDMTNKELSPTVENPLKLDDAWYCNCVGNGEAVLKSTQGLAKFPEVKAVLLARNIGQNLNFGTQGIQNLYKSPYCDVPPLQHLKDLANQKAADWGCPKLWSGRRCQNRRTELREEYTAEAIKNHDTMCQEAARNEALLIESIATKANTEVKTQIVEQNYSPEARAEAEVEMQRKTRQTTWIVLGVVILTGIVIWQILKK